MKLTTKILDKKFPYTGPELRPHYLLTELGLKGSALGVWFGPCEVKTDHMVDWEDRIANDFIRSKEMIHFLGEFFGWQLRETVILQRLLVSIVGAELASFGCTREGDDLFIQGRKLSVSIVTASPVSQLLHLGINIDPEGAPVAAIGLKELGVDPVSLTRKVVDKFTAEFESFEWACAKVRPVV
ncbi:MAG: DUF366 family protein [Xanthomonadaceae bacterium]|nr:DUF366 family protein [Xanthomonadaceae bacterium]